MNKTLNTPKIPISKIKEMKGKEPISMLTCYTYPTAKILEETGIDIILVGDSLGNVVLGYRSTKEVTMGDMLRHTGAVRRGALNSFIVTDMPFKSEQTKESAVKNASLLLNGGADAVKVEGKPEICRALTDSGIDVMGHIGYLPQTAKKPVVYKDKQGLLKQARELERGGCFAVVLEMVGNDVAKEITDSLNIPTIGIGAGPYCDGQVLVINDILGMYDDFKPRFARRYANINDEIRRAVKEYKGEVKRREFPCEE